MSNSSENEKWRKLLQPVITGIDITLLMAGIGAVAKSLHSDHPLTEARC